MLVLLAAALLQVAAPAAPAPPSAASDGAPAAAPAPARPDTARRVRRVPLTAELLRTAYDDAAARELVTRAREARLLQDTTLTSYDATTFQRISAGMGLRRFGRERLLYRSETATRVQWRRDEGAVVDVLGARQATPAGGGALRVEVGDDTGAIPYHPGQETLWFPEGRIRADVNELDGVVHPLARGAEAYYRYRTGDAVTVRLGDGRSIRLREIEVRPRQPRWNLAVGSLWFDEATAQVVRGVYRLSAPLEIWNVVAELDSAESDEVPRWVRTLVNPLRASVGAVTVEYGLEGGRFWMPRLQALEAEAEAGPMRVPVRFEQKFTYSSVNGTLDSLPSLPTAAERLARHTADSLWRDSVRALPEAERDSARAERRRARRSACDGGTASREHGSTQLDGQLAVLVRLPCDTTALVASAALPSSIFAEGEQLFDARMQEALVDAALSLGAQADWGPTPPTVKYGLGDGLLRYNRVEGLSPAVVVESQLGRGYQARALARIGLADLQPNAELALSRTDGRRTLQAAVYRRLAVANDWGEPLGLSSSLVALLFGRDEGFYYRSWGAELSGMGRGEALGGGALAWRLFGERHDAAAVETQFALWNRLADAEFLPNIRAAEGSVTGLGARWVRTFGLDPSRSRLLADLRGEGGVGSFGYGRAIADLTLSRPLPARLDGALTVGGGSTIGEPPAQRLFYLGGPQTVRGQNAGTMIGDAFWMARAELGRGSVAARPTLFADVGWAGDRRAWREPGRVMSGVGAGLSVLDGLLRLDLARGLRPLEQWRVDAYLEARF